VKFKVKTQQH